MSERKNIERLFQEKFKDFEVDPSEDIWVNIETKLDEKKKRRVIPFWWKFSGVAAVLLIGFWIAKSSFQSSIVPKNAIVIDANSVQPAKATNIITSGDPLKNTLPVSNASQKAVTVINKSATVEKSSISEGKNKNTVNVNSFRKAVVENKTASHRSLKNKRNADKNSIPATGTLLEERTNPVAENHKKTNNSVPENKLVSTENNNSTSNNKNLSQNTKTINLDDLKGAPNADSKIVTTEKKVNDTTKIASVATNALEELLNEKESKEKQQSKENRWQITSNVAPVFLGSVTNGSPIDPMFEDNTKEYKTTVSFGVGVSYALNDKLSLRAGINKMAVDYNTNGIVFFADLENPGIANISPSANGKAIRIENATTENAGLLPFENAFVHKNKGYINQKFGYYEVPLELSYAVINKRFGFKIISGISTFFLNENSISVISNSMSTDLGKANNLNEVHFSTNLGLGIKYGFWKSFEFNVEPTVKYQLNTFSDNAGNFKPYLFGVYSGISYKF
ncbi:hypothetical protein [Flavobacterium sp.]|uniref:hypothetical protein n=1 Tax=Flavobacterium sp. TaxID=239 RepID=UPI002FDABA07